MKRLWRRRKLLIDRLQMQLVAVNLLYTGSIVLIFIGVVFGPLLWTMLSRHGSSEEKLIAADRMLVMHESLWPPVIVVTLLFVWHTLVYTHRLAGPLFRFRKVYTAMAEGDLRVRAGTRKRDYLQSECEAVNRMVDGMRERVSAVRTATDSLDETFDELRCQLPGSDPGLCAAVDGLRRRIDTLSSSVDRFVLEDDSPTVALQLPLHGGIDATVPACHVLTPHTTRDEDRASRPEDSA